MLGNACIVYIKEIATNFGIKTTGGMLGKYIRYLQSIGYTKLRISNGEFIQLIINLKTFNRHLNLVKHSIFVANKKIIKPKNENIQLFDFGKEKYFSFSKSEQEKILSLGSATAERLRRILFPSVTQKPLQL